MYISYEALKLFKNHIKKVGDQKLKLEGEITERCFTTC